MIEVGTLKSVWQKISKWYEKNATVLKLLFVLAILVFVIREIGRITHEVSAAQIKSSFASQSPVSLIIMLVVGFIAVTPMLTYDFTITDLLPGTYEKRYVVRSGWVVNTFTNLAGFGGFLGASLRAMFYTKNATKAQVLAAISKIALFLLSGLSFGCWISLALIFGFHIGTDYSQYWYWLLGGALYFPVIFIVTRVSGASFFDDLTLKRELRLMVGSTLEWGACGGFFLLIGYLMGQQHLLAVYPMFIVASVFGVVSMVPGGLGSFDVFMIFGLGMMGINSSVAVVWLLFYRLFYYVLPFIVGAIFFVHDMGHQLNNYFDGLLKQAITRGAQMFLTVFMYFAGIMLLLFAVVPNLMLGNRLYLHLVPFMLMYLNQLTSIVIGFLLIGLARGVGERVKRAFWPTVIVLVLSIINTLYQENFPGEVALFLGIVLVCLWLSRGQFYREHLAYSWGGSVADGAIFAGTFIVYAVAGLFTMNVLHPHLKLSKQVLFPSQSVWISGLIGILLSGFILLAVTRYLSGKQLPFIGEPLNAERMHALIDHYGGNEISHLAFLKDKDVYYYQEDDEDQVAFLFRKKANKLIVMGEPFGNQEKVGAALNAFMTLADQYDYSLVFYQVNETLTMQLHNMGFDFIMAGEEGFVDLPDFTLVGKRRRGERALVNKFDREGYEFKILQPPFSDDTMANLKAISDEWLGDQVEKGFSLGFFDAFYLQQAPIAVMADKDGKLVAFANLMPTGGQETTSIDLMRSSKEAPSGIMDGLFVKLFEESREAGYHYFNLGMTPLSNVGDSRFSFFEERVAHLIYEYGQRLYSFQGLRSYKEKYVDHWEPKYIAYRKRSSIIFTMLQIFQVVNRRIRETERRVPMFLPRIFRR